MRTDKDLAFTLRRAGKSYNEIIAILGVAKSTLSNWFKDVDFSEDIKKTITKQANQENSIRLKHLNKARGDILAAHYIQAEREAIEELKENFNNPLFVAGIMLYWGEGDKLHKNHTRFTNTDPEMLKLFITFLKQFGKFSDNDMRLAVFLYEDLNIEDCVTYWTKQTGISKVHKPMILPSRDKKRRLSHGTASVIIMNTYFKKKLMLWIDQLPKMVLNTVPSGKEK
jgi:hypothetical protein